MLNKKNKLIILLFSLLCCFSSCTSLKQPKNVFSKPDYTDSDVIENEKKRIAEIAANNPVKALWRASLLNDKELFRQYQQKVEELLKESISKGENFQAFKLYTSLKSILGADTSNLGIDENALYASYLADVPGMKVEKSLLPKSIANCIEATVTIWIDKGIAIKNGVGYADRVLGSGFFIDKRGYIITNHHVISDLVDPKYEGYSRLYIKLTSDQENRIPAKVVGYDSVLDLALLKVEIDPPFVFELGSSSELSIGDKVSAIGTPLGLHGTITSGIVSALDRKLFSMGDVFQIDTAVNSGNSGGPLIDSKMRVQAIVFAGILQYQGLNFAIPVEYLRQELPYLYNGGKRTLPWIGCFGHTKKTAMKNCGLEVQYVMPGSSADFAGLKKGDVITSVAGKTVLTLENFQNIMRNFGDDMIISFDFVREEEKKSALLYLEKRPENPGYEIYKSDLVTSSLIPILGMGLVSSSTLNSNKFTITEIIPGSIADESGFSVTDPVTIYEVKFSEEKDSVGIRLSTKNRKKGYLDVSIGLGASLDSPYYF